MYDTELEDKTIENQIIIIMIFLVEIYGNKKLCLFDCAATCNLNIDIAIIIDLIKPIMILKVHLHMYMIPIRAICDP